MAVKEVDYDKLLENLNNMINLLEYDGMRSAGKAKLNAGNLVDLYSLKDRYEAAKAPAEKVTQVEEVKKAGPGRPPKASN